MPALCIGGGDNEDAVTMAGEKDQDALMLLIIDLNASREQVEFRPGQLVEEDDIVATVASTLGDWPALDHAELAMSLMRVTKYTPPASREANES